MVVQGEADHGVDAAAGVLARVRQERAGTGHGTVGGHGEEGRGLRGHAQVRVEVPHDRAAVNQRHVSASLRISPVEEPWSLFFPCVSLCVRVRWCVCDVSVCGVI